MTYQAPCRYPLAARKVLLTQPLLDTDRNSFVQGLASISLDMEVGFICLADLVAKIGFGIYLLMAVLPADEEGENAEKTSLV